MIAIIDYEMGNLRSVQKAVEHVGGSARLVRSGKELAGADKIILPGVAAFDDAMSQLRDQNFVEPLTQALAAGVPYLGFCLGLQLLFDVSYENGEFQGLGILPGKVVRFDFDRAEASEKLSVPHMGWNSIEWDRPCPMLEGVDSGAFVYFAHSYYVSPDDPSLIQTTSEYGVRFASSIWRDNIFATQFHPEKSQSVGLRILKNFVDA